MVEYGSTVLGLTCWPSVVRERVSKDKILKSLMAKTGPQPQESLQKLVQLIGKIANEEKIKKVSKVTLPAFFIF